MAKKANENPLKDLWPGQSVALLKALHILTRDGALNADSRRKLKQVLHLVQLLRPPLDRLFEESENPVLADLGAGKSYLGFILYDLIFAPKGKGEVVAVETRGPLMETAQAIASESGFDRMTFVTGAIGEVNSNRKVDMVTALHACDTATDDAIRFALRHEAKVVALVPCCQAEVARLLDEHNKHPLHQIWRHPIQRRDFASNITNVIRGLYLEAHGYKVRVTELVGLEHSLKNELILAERHQRANAQAKGELQTLLNNSPHAQPWWRISSHDRRASCPLADQGRRARNARKGVAAQRARLTSGMTVNSDMQRASRGTHPMKYVRMPIEIESPEEQGYDTIRFNLSESSMRDRRLSELGLDVDRSGARLRRPQRRAGPAHADRPPKQRPRRRRADDRRRRRRALHHRNDAAREGRSPRRRAPELRDQHRNAARHRLRHRLHRPQVRGRLPPRPRRASNAR